MFHRKMSLCWQKKKRFSHLNTTTKSLPSFDAFIACIYRKYSFPIVPESSPRAVLKFKFLKHILNLQKENLHPKNFNKLVRRMWKHKFVHYTWTWASYLLLNVQIRSAIKASQPKQNGSVLHNFCFFNFFLCFRQITTQQ